MLNLINKIFLVGILKDKWELDWDLKENTVLPALNLSLYEKRRGKPKRQGQTLGAPSHYICKSFCLSFSHFLAKYEILMVGADFCIFIYLSGYQYLLCWFIAPLYICKLLKYILKVT